jgi:hypothetical protein
VIAAPTRLTGGRQKLSDGVGQPIHCGHRRPCRSGVVREDQRWRFFRRETGVGSPLAEPGSVEFTPLIGRIQVSGDWSFGA